jgi:hypothetical protein
MSCWARRGLEKSPGGPLHTRCFVCCFQVESEEDLKGMRVSQAARGDCGTVDLRERMRLLEAELRMAKQEAATARLQ